MRRALILCSAGTGGLQEWLCDLDARTLIRLDELTGMGEEVSAGFADNDTLILTTHTTSEEDETWQTITCYAYDIPTGQKTKTLDKAHYYRWWDEPYGAQLFGSRCVLIGEDGQVRLVDLKTGMQTVVEGFTWQTGTNSCPAPPAISCCIIPLTPKRRAWVSPSWAWWIWKRALSLPLTGKVTEPLRGGHRLEQ